MLQVLYIIAFVVLAVLAVGNLVRNLFSLGIASQRGYSPGPTPTRSEPVRQPHPELLDNSGQVINEPLLVMRSITMEDAREQLDAIYQKSPEQNDDSERT